MTSHKVNVFLGVFVHASTFWNDIAYVFVVLFKPSLLVGYIRIAIKYIGALLAIGSLFYVPGILEFRPVVGKYYREVFLKKAWPKRGVELVDCVYNTLLSASW